MDSKGFYSPTVLDKCVNCGRCLSVCSFYMRNEYLFTAPKEGYACWSKDEQTRHSSTSAGFITELCRKYITFGYKIIAVRYNYKKNIAEHFIATTANDLDSAKGSKYIQSLPFEALKSINQNDYYIVVGTPCMIASFKNWICLRGIDSHFILVDFFCHGLPSYFMWQKYHQHISNQVGNIQHIKWRNKENGWQDSTSVQAVGDKGKYISFHSKGDLFFNFFLGNRCLNTCCYDDCVFKSTHSMADIRVGDFWGSKYADNQLGINSILTFTDQGKNVILNLSPCEVIAESVETIIQGQMKTNAKRSPAFDYVKKALKKDTALSEIDKKACRIEKLHKLIEPKFYKFLFKRLKSIIIT